MTFIKTTALLSTLLIAAAPLGAHAQLGPVAAPQGGATLSVTFQGMKTPSGRILAALFDSEAAWTGKGAGLGLAAAVTGDRTVATLPGLKPGRYAIRAFHDLNGDGKLGTNPFGVPTEPFAFSNNAHGSMGPAKWADAAFDVGPGGAAHTIAID